MVLYPLIENPAPAGSDDFRPAWDAIAARQSQISARYWLITQPDHALLAGALAANLVTRFFDMHHDIIRAIALHDAGWTIHPSEREAPAPPPTAASGKPLSFLEIDPADFIPAWQASIEKAAATGPAGAIIVSEHFCRLAQTRLQSETDNPSDLTHLSTFLQEEGRRQAGLRSCSPHSAAELELLTDVLQFCDLLSLYLCCGARDTAAFPQNLGGETFRLHYRDGAYSLLSQKKHLPDALVRLSVRAWPYPRPPHPLESHSVEFNIH